MPRIRTVKPQFWSSPRPPSRDARLLYIAMWNWADDEGVGTAAPKELGAFAFPYDEDLTPGHIRELLREISGSYQVVFYEVGGRPYYEIQNFLEHQVINKPNGPKWPKPTEAESFLHQPDDFVYKPLDLQIQRIYQTTTGALPESSGTTTGLEVGNRKSGSKRSGGPVRSKRPVSDARDPAVEGLPPPEPPADYDDDRPRDRMGRPSMSLGPEPTPPTPPPADRHVPAEATEIINAVVPKQILSSHKISFALKCEIGTLLNNGAERADIESTLKEWMTREGAFPGDIKHIYTDIIKRQLGPVKPRNGHQGRDSETIVSEIDAMRDNPRLPENQRLENIFSGRREIASGT